MLLGARQVGKSTLVQELLEPRGASRTYLTLDDRNVLAAAQRDPMGFVSGITGPVTIDEVQRAPEIFSTLKACVDRNRLPGQFILTGSANVLLLPGVADYLVGRMETFVLWPLSQGEIGGTDEKFVDAAFRRQFEQGKSYKRRTDIVQQVTRGGYPEVVRRETVSRRDQWFHSYVDTMLSRDVRDLANIEKLNELPQLLSLLAARVGSLSNFSELSRTSALPQSTLKRYVALFQHLFLIKQIPAWAGNFSKRVAKAPKLYFSDTALCCYLLGLDGDGLAANSRALGAIFENFIVMELCKQISWSETQPSMFHFRAHDQTEVDIVLENRASKIVGIEVKLADELSPKMWQGLARLRDETADKFVTGVVLYSGNTELRVDKNIWAVPIARLWA